MWGTHDDDSAEYERHRREKKDVSWRVLPKHRGTGTAVVIQQGWRQVTEGGTPVEFHAQLAAARARLAALQVSQADLQKTLGAYEEILLWSQRGATALEKNDCSRLHKLREAIDRKQLCNAEEFRPNNLSLLDKLSTDQYDQAAMMLSDKTFVVKHDWGAALGAATDDGQFVLPFEHCMFEFRISGRTVIVAALQVPPDMRGGEIQSAQAASLFVEANGLWFYVGAAEARAAAAGQLAWNQIKAICIALDAEVATHTIQRQPAKLNEKRVRSGKVSLPDYYVVDLAKRHRIANPLGGSGGGKKRLHFRRGHWRHLAEVKTWVRWCLVGDPDLGFIHKHYAL